LGQRQKQASSGVSAGLGDLTSSASGNHQQYQSFPCECTWFVSVAFG
jgi:hypothetical protein